VTITTQANQASAAIEPTVADDNPGDTFTYTIAGQPSHGTAQVSSNKLVYTP